MSSFAAFNIKLLNLQPRLVSLPWVKRSLVRCFSRKAGDPVRYIPKKVPDLNQNGNDHDSIPGSRTDHEHSNVLHGESKKTNKLCKKAVEHVIFPVEVVQDLQISKREFNHNGIVEIHAKEMQLYNVTAQAKQKNLQTCRTEQGAKKIAIQLLAKRALTGVELRKKLTAKMFPVIVVEAVVRDFQDRGLINDRLYAEVFSCSRWKSSSWGPRRIKQELVKKGISEGDVEKAVKMVFEDENCDERSDITLSASSLQQLYVEASKQWQRCRNVAHEKRKARVIRWLQYRGFDWGVVSSILKKLEAQCP